jgi:hypothetical protein
MPARSPGSGKRRTSFKLLVYVVNIGFGALKLKINFQCLSAGLHVAQAELCAVEATVNTLVAFVDI